MNEHEQSLDHIKDALEKLEGHVTEGMKGLLQDLDITLAMVMGDDGADLPQTHPVLIGKMKDGRYMVQVKNRREYVNRDFIKGIMIAAMNLLTDDKKGAYELDTRTLEDDGERVKVEDLTDRSKK